MELTKWLRESTRKKFFSGLKLDAVPQDIFDVSAAIQSVLSSGARDTYLNDTVKLVQAQLASMMHTCLRNKLLDLLLFKFLILKEAYPFYLGQASVFCYCYNIPYIILW
ncbi:DUF1659 domain-containing protein [Clostridium vincentii]|uniref:DUF1659 domain-containing protein n=1 Tax=Clostridium vincentii TaxID=52704 RepID=UPI000D046521|nr:DUF1659 domain-containing protein [Clostridium vincentii]